MSGGSWEYVYEKIETAAARLLGEPDPRRRALGDFLARAAKAMKAIEWHDSGDWGQEEETAALDLVLTKEMEAEALLATLNDLTDYVSSLERRVRAGQGPAR